MVKPGAYDGTSAKYNACLSSISLLPVSTLPHYFMTSDKANLYLSQLVLGLGFLRRSTTFESCNHVYNKVSLQDVGLSSGPQSSVKSRIPFNLLIQIRKGRQKEEQK